MQTLTRWRGAGAAAASVQRGCKKNIEMNINICQYRINALKEELTQKMKINSLCTHPCAGWKLD